MNKCPCMNCTSRCFGCHGQCSDYARFQKINELIAKKRRAENDLIRGYINDKHLRDWGERVRMA